MEKAVLVAVACVVSNLLGAAAVLAMTFTSKGDNPILLAIYLPIGVLLIPGIWRGKRLAWHGGVYVSAAVTFCFFFPPPDWEPVAPMILGAYGLLSFLLICSLTSKGALRHFRLICPHCGSKSTKAKDLLFRRAQCRYCETIW